MNHRPHTQTQIYKSSRSILSLILPADREATNSSPVLALSQTADLRSTPDLCIDNEVRAQRGKLPTSWRALFLACGAGQRSAFVRLLQAYISWTGELGGGGVSKAFVTDFELTKSLMTTQIYSSIEVILG